MTRVSRALAALAFAPLLAGFTDPPNLLVAVCERALMDRLLIPSSYKRIRYQASAHRMTREEVVAWLPNNFTYMGAKPMLDDFDAGKIRPHTLKLTLVYEAANGSYMPTERTALCEHDSLSEEPMVQLAPRTRIDGEDSLRWFFRQPLGAATGSGYRH